MTKSKDGVAMFSKFSPDTDGGKIPAIEIDGVLWVPFCGTRTADAYHVEYRRANSPAVASMGRL